MREEKFNLQARRFDTFFAKKICTLLNRFKYGHAKNLNRNRPIQNFFWPDSFLSRLWMNKPV